MKYYFNPNLTFLTYLYTYKKTIDSTSVRKKYSALGRVTALNRGGTYEVKVVEILMALNQSGHWA